MSPLTISGTQPTLFSGEKSKQQQPFSGGATRPLQFGTAAGTTQNAAKLTFWQTLKAIKQQLALEDKDNQEIFKGLVMKYGSNLALPAFFSVPVLGWIAGAIAMPFVWVAEAKGAKIIDSKRAHLATKKDKPLYHVIKLQDLWDGTAKVPKDLSKNPAKNRDTASRMARSWNRLIDRLFTHDEAGDTSALKAKLNIALDEHKNPKDGRFFKRFQHFMNVSENLQKSWGYKIFLRPLDWIYRKLPLPRVIKGIILLPKLIVLGAGYMMKAKQ